MKQPTSSKQTHILLETLELVITIFVCLKSADNAESNFKRLLIIAVHFVALLFEFSHKYVYCERIIKVCDLNTLPDENFI